MNRRKSMIVIAMVALLLTFTVSGTIAWLAASTDEVVNVFEPGKVKTDIPEKIEDGFKTEIAVKNDREAGSTVPVFVRVSVSGYYVKDVNVNGSTVQEIVKQWDGTFSVNDAMNTGTGDGIANGKWMKGDDGFYYYSGSVAPGEVTTNLLQSGKGIDLNPREDDGTYLVVNVIHQSIQYKPAEAVESVWPVKAKINGVSGTIELKNN